VDLAEGPTQEKAGDDLIVIAFRGMPTDDLVATSVGAGTAHASAAGTARAAGRPSRDAQR
jgi:hypothetical protein